MEYEETEFIAPEPVEDECPTFEAVDVSHAAGETGVNPLPFPHHEHEDATIEDVIVVEDITAVEDAAVVDAAVEDAAVQDASVGEDVVEKVTTVEDVDTVDDVDIVEDVDTVEDTTTVEDVDTVEDVATVEDVTDKDLPLPLIQSLEGVDEDIPESVAQDALWTMTLISEASPPLDKRESMSVTDMIDEDEFPLPLSVPLVREKTVKGNARSFSDIWGCEGIGPVVVKGLVAFLMQPWMINRELPTQVRKLSRIIIPKKRLRKKKSVLFSEAAACSFIHLPVLMGWL
ncbi:hypothetical protein E4U31_006517 [Claviceps sp. LM219 group G6]|nr:hypothetical protein E4U31_006517 [Claviceps sp. LM219 group G6]